MPDFNDYVAQFDRDKSVRWIEPMSAHDTSIYDYEPTGMDIAELKYDGHRGVVYFNRDGNRAFSRTVSKKTDWFTENTDNIPHIRDLKHSIEGTVLDGEFDYGNTSMGVQSVMGALPGKAIEFQKEHGNLPFKAFDILYYKGINLQRMPLWKRKYYLALAVRELNNKDVMYAHMYGPSNNLYNFMELLMDYTEDEGTLTFMGHHMTEIVDYRTLFRDFLNVDLEGIMIKPLDGVYEQKRSKNYLKVKGVSTWDCVVMGFTPPTKEYDGKEIHKWKYWEADDELLELNGEKEAEWYEATNGVIVRPVTKPYFNGWCGAIEFGVWKDGELVHVGDCKGLADKELENIRKNGDSLIGSVIEVKANGIIDEKRGSLRHPRFVKWRKDKTSEQCDWNSHIRKLGDD